MPVLSVVHYNRANWDAASTRVSAAIIANSTLLRVTNVHQGQSGDIEFAIGAFTNVPAGATNSVLGGALTPDTLASGTTIKLHGHYQLVQGDDHVWRKEIRSIAFKCGASSAASPRYLGWVNHTALPAAQRTRLDHEINRRRWQGR